jgi:hypothetical protein
MKNVFLNNVTLAPAYTFVAGGRMATVNLSPKAFLEKFGEPQTKEEPNIITGKKVDAYRDTKVTVIWTFTTPRGPAEVRDYWWNRPNELSLASANQKQALWLAKYLRAKGVSVT